MKRSNRATGIDPISRVPWGTHICHFYRNEEDLLSLLVPYVKAGLENNELCMWIISEPLSIDDAIISLERVVGSLDYYAGKGQIEVEGRGIEQAGGHGLEAILAGDLLGQGTIARFRIEELGGESTA